MPLRLIECTLTKESASEILENLDRSTVLGAWCIAQDDDTQLLRILANAERTEALVERLESELTFDESRIFLTEVLATLPEPADEEDEPNDEDEPPPDRVAAIELSSKLSEEVSLNVNFFVMVAMSTIVAAVGLINDDTAVVIGAMVIAPLLSPNIALALGTTLAEPELLKKAAWALFVTLGLAALFSFLVGAVIPLDPAVSTLASRADIGFGDVVLALAAGVAGALAFTTGVSQGIVGVMVAVALLPSLVAAGLLAGAGEWSMAGKAGLLFASNVCGVNLAAMGTFIAKGLRPDFMYGEEKRRANLGLAVGAGTWTVLLLLVFGAILYLEWFA